MHAVFSSLSLQEGGLLLRLRVPSTEPILVASRFAMGDPNRPEMLRACYYREVLLESLPNLYATSGKRWCMAPKNLPEPVATRAEIRAAGYSAISVPSPETAPLAGLPFRRW